MGRHLAHLRYVLGTERRVRATARSLRLIAERANGPADVVAAAFGTTATPLAIAPLQLPSELERFLALVAAEHPRNVLEIGTGVGGTLYGLAWASDPAARILSLDLTIYPPQRRRLYRGFAANRRRVEVWAADSHLDSTHAEVQDHFGGGPLDLLFIDGAHAYESVSRDYALYGPLVREGGVIAFHDIVDGPHEAVGDVPRFWREIRGELVDPVEIIESPDQPGFGIGVGRRAAATSHGR